MSGAPTRPLVSLAKPPEIREGKEKRELTTSPRNQRLIQRKRIACIFWVRLGDGTGEGHAGGGGGEEA